MIVTRSSRPQHASTQPKSPQQMCPAQRVSARADTYFPDVASLERLAIGTSSDVLPR